MNGVLIADQSAGLARDIAAACQGIGLVVLGVARDGLEAVDLASRLQPSHLVLDMLLPRLSGSQVLATLARLGLSPLVIVVSAITAREAVQSARQAGAHAYLLKPLSAAKLIEVLSSRLPQPAHAVAR